jgi:hypothetical protein
MLEPGTTTELAWRVPDTGGNPIAEIGLEATARAAGPVSVGSTVSPGPAQPRPPSPAGRGGGRCGGGPGSTALTSGRRAGPRRTGSSRTRAAPSSRRARPTGSTTGPRRPSPSRSRAREGSPSASAASAAGTACSSAPTARRRWSRPRTVAGAGRGAFALEFDRPYALSLEAVGRPPARVRSTGGRCSTWPTRDARCRAGGVGLVVADGCLVSEAVSVRPVAS